MSLINDMLRDLEQRRKQEAQQKPLSSSVAVNRKSVKKRPPLIPGTLVVLMMVMLVAGWTYYLPKESVSPLKVAASAVHDGAIEAPPSTTVTPALVLGSEPLTSASPLLMAVNLVDDAQQVQLELTFNLFPAGVEIRSLPEEGRVLIRLPATQLKQGVVVPQPQRDNISKISMVPTSAGLDLIIALVAGQHVATSQHFDQHRAKLVIGLDFPPLPSVEVLADSEVKIETTSAALPPAPEVKPNVGPALTPAATLTQPLVRTQRLPETDEQLYQLGLQQLRQGDLRAAQENFAGALRTNPEHLTARLELIGVLQRRADEQSALRLIQEGLQLQPAQPELRKLFAHHLLYQQRHHEALAQLEQVPIPVVGADPDYHALRAAIYQELGDYPRAALLYAQLLEQRPREHLWWLGLAIALEQQGMSSGARDAYRTALEGSGLRPDLERFVHERLQHL